MSKKAYTFCVHDDTVNTYGFRMLTAGANLAEFAKNPVVLYNHNDWDAPIGRGENIRKDGDRILVDIVFDTDDPKAADIAGKVERGFLRMCSVGAWAEEASDDPALKLKGQTGATVTRWTVREVSVCAIGANHNALAMYDRRSGQRINLNDNRALEGIITNINKREDMSTIRQLLKLQDSASDQAVQEAVSSLIALRDSLQAENATLKTDKQTLQAKVDGYEKKEREASQARAVTLVDEAVKDGRIDASGKDAWLKAFETDFAGSEVRLNSIAKRQNIHAQVDPGKPAAGTAVQLRDMSFDDILKADRLKELKQNPELYKEKFREAYGHEPA